MPIPEPWGGNSSGVDHLKHLAVFEKAHKLDPNFPMDELNDVDAALATGNAEKGLEIEHALMEDNSPYPEVGHSPPPSTPNFLVSNISLPGSSCCTKL